MEKAARDRLAQAAELHRSATAVMIAATAALDSHLPMPRMDVAEQHDLAHRLRQACGRLTPGWLGTPLDSHAELSLGEQRRPEFVRVGTAQAADDVTFPMVVPLLGTGHLTFSADARDTRVAGALRSVLLRLLATAPAGSLIVRAVDATASGLFASFGPLAEAGIMPPAATDLVGLRAMLTEAEHWCRPNKPEAQRRPTTRPRRRDCTMLLVVGTLPSTVESIDLARMATLAQIGPPAGLHLIVAGWPPPSVTGHAPNPELAVSTQIALRTAYSLVGGAVFTTASRPEGPSPTEVWPGLSVPVRLDPDPPAKLIQRVCRDLAERFSAQGAVHLMDLLPDPDQWWADSSAEGLSTTVGLAGDAPVHLRFTDLTPHWLVSGRPGSGRTSFLLNVLYGLCTRYDPDELQLYLVGFSPRGFAPTDTDPCWMPHVRAISDDGAAVLRELAEEISDREVMGPRFQQIRQSMALPRIVCFVDSAAISEDLEPLTRRGRQYGVHLVLCGRGAVQGAAESQFLVRVALPGGSDVLAATNDSAATLPVGKAVVNTAGGLGGPRGATRGHEKIVRFPDPDADQQVLAALRRRLWQARDPSASAPRSL